MKTNKDLYSRFKLIDMFAPEVSLTFEGRTKFKTSIGAIATLISVLIVGAYITQAFVKVVSGQKESITTQLLHRSLHTESSFNPADFGFSIAFGSLEQQLDPEYVQFQLERRKVTYVNDTQVVETIAMPVEPCADQI